MKAMRIISILIVMTFSILALSAFIAGIYRFFFTPEPSTYLFGLTALSFIAARVMYREDKNEYRR